MKGLNDHTIKLIDHVYGHFGSLPLLFDTNTTKGESQEEFEENVLNQFKDRVEDAWFETEEDGRRQLYVKPYPAVEELKIKVGGTI